MLVRELMSTDVTTVTSEASLDVAVETLLSRGIGSLVVVDDADNPLGLLTESDVLRVAQQRNVPLSALAVTDAGHSPVVTTSPGTAVATVAREMADKRVKKVPVMDGVALVGIVTLSDIVWHLSSLRQESSELAALRSEWDQD